MKYIYSKAGKDFQEGILEIAWAQKKSDFTPFDLSGSNIKNPPFSKNIKTNIARNFLNLVDTHFPAGHKLHKVFNRNTVKVSYSCMNNVKNIISKHNTRKIRKSQPQVINTTSCNCRNKETCPLISKHNTCIIGKSQPQVINTASCNCRNKETCPLQNKCMSKNGMQEKRHETLHRHDFKHISRVIRESCKIFYSQKILK